MAASPSTPWLSPLPVDSRLAKIAAGPESVESPQFEVWATLNSDTSRSFDKPKNGRIAVKAINHLGADKPVGHKDGPSPIAPGVGSEQQQEASLTEWSEQGFEIEKGSGFSVQGQGNRDDVVNPAPDGDGGGNGGEEPEKRTFSAADAQAIGQNIAMVEGMLKEQFPGMDFSLVDVIYVRLHNPDPLETQSQGDGETQSTSNTGAGASSASQGAGMGSEAEAALQSLINPDPLAALDDGALPSAPQGNAALPAGDQMQVPGAGPLDMQPQGTGTSFIGQGSESSDGRPKP